MGNSAISLDRLMRPQKTVDLPNGQQVVVRALAAQELSLRQKAATRAAAVAEAEARKEGTEEYETYILPILTSSIDELRAAYVGYARLDAQTQVFDKIKAEYIPEPDEATPEEQREVVLKREAHLEDVNRRRSEWVEAYVAEAKERAEKLEDEERLRAEIRRRTEKLVADIVYNETYLDQTHYLSVRNPDGTSYFSTPTEARYLHSAMSNLLAEAFAEVNDIDPLSLNGQSSTA